MNELTELIFAEIFTETLKLSFFLVDYSNLYLKKSFFFKSMNAYSLFNFLNTLVLIPWLLMILAPYWKWTKALVNSYLVPLILSLVYALLIFINFGAINFADFGSLQGILKLFKNADAWTMSAAWYHYLAFDLLVGTWISNDALSRKINHFLVIPCLFLTFMLGPVGFLFYQLVRLTSVKRG